MVETVKISMECETEESMLENTKNIWIYANLKRTNVE